MAQAVGSVVAGPVIPAATTLSSEYLTRLATRQAQVDAAVDPSAVTDLALDCLEQFVHFVFSTIFYVFYPAYEQFYDEQRVTAFAISGKELPVEEASWFRENVLFLHQFLASPASVGSVIPSSSSLIECITSKIEDRCSSSPESRRLLEIGAGVGSFTREIVRRMGPKDHLDVVEFDADFCKELRRQFRHDKRVTIHHQDILKFEGANQYDAIVSGLPLNALSGEFAEQAHDKYAELGKAGATVSYFEYIGVPLVRRAVLCGDAAADFDRMFASKAKFVRDHDGQAEHVYCNFPPARVQHCTVNKNAPPRVEE